MSSTKLFWSALLSSSLAFICVCVCIHHAFLPLHEIRHDLKLSKISIADGYLERFMNGLRYATISWNPDEQNFTALSGLTNFIRENYPLLHSSTNVHHEVVNNYSLLYIIKGSNKSLKPALFSAHLDVVPTTGQDWQSDPFDPVIRDGFLYARGALDDKGVLFGLLEAGEGLLRDKLTPDRDIIFAFGHDEEISGHQGAQKLAARIKQLGYTAVEFLIDEGLLVLDNAFPGIYDTFALIGTSMKGFVTLNLTVELEGGHSSMPPKESAIGVLAKAVKALEDNPMPSRLGHGVEAEFLQKIARKFSIGKRIFLSNLWLFKPIVEQILSVKPQTNALIRTTTALTMFNSGMKENVLAHRASAVVNFRLHPADSEADVVAHVGAAIKDPRVEVHVTNTRHPTGNSPSRGAIGYELLEATIQQIFPQAVISPCLMIAMADAPWYRDLTQNFYFFNPTWMNASDSSGIHGRNERIRTTSFEQLVEFQHRLLRNLNGFKVAPKHKHVEEF